MQRNTRVRAPGLPAMGYVPSTPAEFARNASFRLTRGKREARPSSVLLTDYLPPIGDQGDQGSCVGWSTAYYNYSYGVAKQLHLTRDQQAQAKFQFSPAFIYHLGNGGEDHGMTVARAFEILSDKGCASLLEMPYDDGDYTTTPDGAALKRADRYRAPQVGCLFKGGENGRPDVEALKTFLAEARQPFVIGIPVFKDFPGGGDFPGGPSAAKDFVYHLSIEPTRENFRGGHAICIVGYDDDKQAFRMVNSWGPNWMDGGFMWLGEDFVHDWAGEGWADVTGGPSARAIAKLPAQIAPHATLVPPAARRLAPR
jgi:hypothetical protein